jgi:hypothetical protein
MSVSIAVPRDWAFVRRVLLVVLLAVLLSACGGRQKEAVIVPEPPPPPPPEAEVVPEAPLLPFPDLPEDGRVIVDASEYPWSAVGRVNTGGRGHCTGLLIGPRHVLASAPCLFNTTEGRWWHHTDVYFVAGYQFETYQAASRAADFLVPPGYQPQGGVTLAKITNNWALITLEKTVGNEVGWFGTQTLDQAMRSRIGLGEAMVAPVGYRRGRPHALILNMGCSLNGPVRSGPGMKPDCEVLPHDVAMPPLAFDYSALRALGEQLPGGAAQASGPLAEALRANGVGSAEGQPPRQSGKVSPLPLATIELFLGYLEILRPAAEGVSPEARNAERETAIREFQQRYGLPVDGQPSVKLLGYLIWAAQPGPAVSELVPLEGIPALAYLRPGRP